MVWNNKIHKYYYTQKKDIKLNLENKGTDEKNYVVVVGAKSIQNKIYE